MTNNNASVEATQSKDSISSSDGVSDPVSTLPCHGATRWSNPAVTPVAGNDQGAPKCATAASTPDVDTASQLSLLPGAALTALATPATAALLRLGATTPTVHAWAALLRRLRGTIRGGGPVLWADVLELYTLWLQGQVAAGALEEGSAAKYLDLVTQFVNHCVLRTVVISSVDVAERLGTALAQGWVDDVGSNRRTRDPVISGPAIRAQRASAGRSLWYVLRLFGVSERDLFVDVDVPPRVGGPKSRPLDDGEALALRTWATDHPQESAQNAAVAGALHGAKQGTLSLVRVCDVDPARGLVRMPDTRKNRARFQALDSFGSEMFARRIDDVYRLHNAASGAAVESLYLLSGRGQPTTAENVGMMLRNAIELAGLRSERVTPTSLALWGSLRAYHRGPRATVLSAAADPLGTRDIDAAAYVRGVTTRTASDSLGLSTADKGDDPYGLANY